MSELEGKVISDRTMLDWIDREDYLISPIMLTCQFFSGLLLQIFFMEYNFILLFCISKTSFVRTVQILVIEHELSNLPVMKQQVVSQ